MAIIMQILYMGGIGMQDKSLMFYMIRSELEDAVGVENVSTKEVERAV